MQQAQEEIEAQGENASQEATERMVSHGLSAMWKLGKYEVRPIEARFLSSSEIPLQRVEDVSAFYFVSPFLFSLLFSVFVQFLFLFWFFLYPIPFLILPPLLPLYHLIA